MSILAKPLSFKFVFLLLMGVIVILGGIGLYFYLYPKQEGGSSEEITLEFSCPVPEEYCRNFERAYEWDEEVGFGYKLPEETEIYTVVVGDLSFGSVHWSSEEAYIARLVSPLGYTIDYYFKGWRITPSLYRVGAGALIGRVGAGTDRFDGLTLVIKVSESGSGEPVLVDPTKVIKE